MDFNRLTRIVEPSQFPVTVADVKSHLRLIGTDEDTYLTSLIETACAMIDGPYGVGVALCPAIYEYSLDGLWPCFIVPLYPITKVEKIEWIDAEGVAQSTTDLRVNNRRNPVTVSHDVRSSVETGSVVVTLHAGYQTVPADLRHAVLMLIGHLYENREATTERKLETVPMAVETILNRYRMS